MKSFNAARDGRYCCRLSTSKCLIAPWKKYIDQFASQLFAGCVQNGQDLGEELLSFDKKDPLGIGQIEAVRGRVLFAVL